MSALSVPYINTIGVTSHGKALCVFTASLLPPAFAKVMFLHVYVCPRGRGLPGQVLPPGQVHTDPQAGTSPWQVHPLGRYHLGRYTPQIGTPPRQVHPPPQCMLGYGQQAGGTHPTGMHSCTKNAVAALDNKKYS